jgi:tight adherence protein C
MILVLIYVFLIAGIILIAIGIQSSPRFSTRRIPLPMGQSKPRSTNLGSYAAIAFPFIQKFLERLKLDVKIKNKLDAAHANIKPAQFVTAQLIFMLAAGVVAILVSGKFDPIALVIGLALGYAIPEIWLKRRISQRKYEIARVLPETVDLLGLCVEAGLDFTTSVKWIIEKKVTSNPMIEELTQVLEEIKWGKSRSQSLKDMARRLNISEVSSFVQALVQAERMGTPVSEAFNIISEDTRTMRFRRGERHALQAPIKILIPLIFCILPVIGIVIGGPILLQFMHGSLFSGLSK